MKCSRIPFHNPCPQILSINSRNAQITSLSAGPGLSYRHFPSNCSIALFALGANSTTRLETRHLSRHGLGRHPSIPGWPNPGDHCRTSLPSRSVVRSRRHRTPSNSPTSSEPSTRRGSRHPVKECSFWLQDLPFPRPASCQRSRRIASRQLAVADLTRQPNEHPPRSRRRRTLPVAASNTLNLHFARFPCDSQFPKMSHAGNGKPPKTSLFSGDSLVAGVGFEPTTFRLCGSLFSSSGRPSLLSIVHPAVSRLIVGNLLDCYRSFATVGSQP